MKEGDRLRFYYLSNARDDVLCQVLATTRYGTFKQMLKMEGVDNCSPCRELGSAVDAYLSIPKYRERQSILGVIALRLRVIENHRRLSKMAACPKSGLFNKSITMRRPVIDMIRNGRKKIEPRIATAILQQFRTGDQLTIVNAVTKDRELLCQITDRRHYQNAVQLFATEGLNHCAPGMDLETALRSVLLHNDKMKAAETLHGVFAFHLKMLEDHALARVTHSPTGRRVRVDLIELHQLESGEKTGYAYFQTNRLSPFSIGDTVCFNHPIRAPKSKNRMEHRILAEVVDVVTYKNAKEFTAKENLNVCIMPYRMENALHTSQWPVIVIRVKPIGEVMKIDDDAYSDVEDELERKTVR